MSSNDELKKKEKFGQLLILYGKLLTNNIYSRMEMFYLNDYSITEIAQNENVSRNAIFESLSHGEKQLENFENKLKLAVKYKEIFKKIDKLSTMINDENGLKIIDEIKGELDYGI